MGNSTQHFDHDNLQKDLEKAIPIPRKMFRCWKLIMVLSIIESKKLCFLNFHLFVYGVSTFLINSEITRGEFTLSVASIKYETVKKGKKGSNQNLNTYP